MKKLKNKFIYIVVFLIISVIWFEVYKTFLVSNIDRNSYAVLINWEAKLNENDLKINKKEKLEENDLLKTIWEESLVIIKWWDWSITRMWWNSEILIEKSEVEQNLLNIKISFELIKWKTWSDVISFIWEDSYFHQSFADTTAAVRWTVFEVNLEKDYVYIDKHELKLTRNDRKTQILNENNYKKALEISSFSFIDFTKFLRLIKDKAWQNLNIKLDKEFYNDLKVNLKNLEDLEIKAIEGIESLTQEKKQELYNELLKDYQKLKFIEVSDIELYNQKLSLKKQLIKVSSDENKKNLIRTSFYDLDDLFKNRNFSQLSDTFEIFAKNPSSLEAIDVRFTDYIDLKSFNNIDLPEWLKQEFKNNFESIKQSLNIDFEDNIFVDSAKKQIDNLKYKVDDIKNLIK